MDESGNPPRGHRLPEAARLGRVRLQVADLERSLVYYREVLGFRVLHRSALGLAPVVWSYPGALFLSAGGYHHHLGVNTWAGPGAAPPGEDDARLLEWEVVVPGAEDAGAAARSLEAAGYPVERTEEGWRAVDPWGTALRVVGSSPRDG